MARPRPTDIPSIRCNYGSNILYSLLGGVRQQNRDLALSCVVSDTSSKKNTVTGFISMLCHFYQGINRIQFLEVRDMGVLSGRHRTLGPNYI